MNSRNHHMWSSYSSYLIRKVAGIEVSQKRVTRSRASNENNRIGFDSLVFSPGCTSQSSPNQKEMKFSDLSSVKSALHLNQGDAKWSWKQMGGTQCDRAPLGYHVHLNCGEDGGIIKEILFASFGHPKGVNCDSLVADSIVHSPESMDMVKKYCLDKQRCDIPVHEDLFPLKDQYS